MVMRVDREQITAFRLASHHLAQRLPEGALLTAAGACGIQNTPPGSAELALHARISNLQAGDLDRAVLQEKTLVETWAMRAAPYITPTTDIAIFTRGLRPEDEAAQRFFLLGAQPGLDRVGISANELVGQAARALPEVLGAGGLTKDALGLALAKRLAPSLDGARADAWQLPSWYAPGQTLGESLVRFALPLLALETLICLVPQRRRAAVIMPVKDWLGEYITPVEENTARVELVRRYLHCYGPSTAANFARWTGISPEQAERDWGLIRSELEEVSADKSPAWILSGDAASLTTLTMPAGTRLLPPHDPYLAVRDRETLIEDQAVQRRAWRTSGNPGMVLSSGRITGLWRARKTSRAWLLTVELLKPGAAAVRAGIEQEANMLARLRGCAAAEVSYTEEPV